MELLFIFGEVNRIEGLIDRGDHQGILIPHRPIGLARLEGDGEVDEQVIGMDVLDGLAELLGQQLLVGLLPEDAIFLGVFYGLHILLEEEGRGR